LRLWHLYGFLLRAVDGQRNRAFTPKCNFLARSSGLPIFFGQSRIFLDQFLHPIGTVSAHLALVKKLKKAKNTPKTKKRTTTARRTPKARKASKTRRTSRKRNDDGALSPEADQWLAAALAEYNSKLDVMKRDWGFDSFDRWAFDPVTKIFTLQFADGTEFEADGQLLGTYCPGDSSWEWAWNNPNVETHIAVPGDKLKEIGQRLGISYLTAGKVPVPTREFAAYLCAVGLKAIEAIGVYLGGEPPVEAAIVLYNPRRKLKAA
jgi:hypothetical protein